MEPLSTSTAAATDGTGKRALKIGIVAPVASAHVARFLHDPAQPLPDGYTGAPLTGVLIGELLRRGHEVHALTVDYALPPGAVPVLARGERFTLQILPGRRRAWRFESGRPGRALDLFRDERRALTAALLDARPDLVHAHWTYEFALAALDSGLPHVITAHDSPRQIVRYTRSPYRMLRWLMAREALAGARCVTAVSDYMAAEVQTLARVPVQVVPNPIDPLALALGRDREQPAGRRVAMICNGWGIRKNPEPALLAFERLRRQYADAQLHLFGNDFGPGERAQAWATSQGIAAGMIFHGMVPHDRLLQTIAGLDLLLHPALEESFGVVVAEAMALGLPVVAGARSGAVPDVAGPQQWLVDVRDPVVIRDAIVEALSDPLRYANASTSGRARVGSNYAASSVVSRYLAVYDQVRQSSAALRCPSVQTELT